MQFGLFKAPAPAKITGSGTRLGTACVEYFNCLGSVGSISGRHWPPSGPKRSAKFYKPTKRHKDRMNWVRQETNVRPARPDLRQISSTEAF